MYTTYEKHLQVNEGLFNFIKNAFNKFKDYSKKIENAPKIDKAVATYKIKMTELYNKKIELEKQIVVKEVEYEKAKNNPDLKKSYETTKNTVTKQMVAITKLITAEKSKFDNIVNNLATTDELKKYLEASRAKLNVELSQMEYDSLVKFGESTTTKNMVKNLKTASENVNKLQKELDDMLAKKGGEAESMDFSKIEVGGKFTYLNSSEETVNVTVEKLDTELTEESKVENEPNKAVENKTIKEEGDKWIQVKSEKGSVFHVQKKNLKAVEEAKPAETKPVQNTAAV